MSLIRPTSESILVKTEKTLNSAALYVSRFPAVVSAQVSEILIGLIDMHGLWLSCLIIYESVTPYMICELVTKITETNICDILGGYDESIRSIL